MNVEHKLNPCNECGKVDRIKVGETPISCQRCNRYCVSTSFYYFAFTWNYQNQVYEV